MSAALQRGWRKGARTLAQIAAGGALTAFVTAIVGRMDPTIQGVVLGAWTAIIAGLQNWLETGGKIPTLLPTPSVVIGASGPGVAVATVEAEAGATGDIAGTVTDTEGATVGEVVGQLGYVDKPKGDPE